MDTIKILKEKRMYCFAIVNRGKVWYDKLSSEQIGELSTWYENWLNVTETFIEPTAPLWIEKEFINLVGSGEESRPFWFAGYLQQMVNEGKITQEEMNELL